MSKSLSEFKRFLSKEQTTLDDAIEKGGAISPVIVSTA